MLFTKGNKEEIMEICESIMNGTELTVKQLDTTYLFLLEVKNKIERKAAMVLGTVYPTVWKEFYDLDNFNIYDETFYFTYTNSDDELVSFSFPLRLLGLSRKELEAEAENMQKD